MVVKRYEGFRPEFPDANREAIQPTDNKRWSSPVEIPAAQAEKTKPQKSFQAVLLLAYDRSRGLKDVDINAATADW